MNIKIINLINLLSNISLINIFQNNKQIKLKMMLIFVIIIKLNNKLINKLDKIRILN